VSYQCILCVVFNLLNPDITLKWRGSKLQMTMFHENLTLPLCSMFGRHVTLTYWSLQRLCLCSWSLIFLGLAVFLMTVQFNEKLVVHTSVCLFSLRTAGAVWRTLCFTVEASVNHHTHSSVSLSLSLSPSLSLCVSLSLSLSLSLWRHSEVNRLMDVCLRALRGVRLS